MSFYAAVVVIDTDSPEEIHELLPQAIFAGDPWEVRPDNDLNVALAAGKWVGDGEEGGYYPNADPEFDTDSVLDQRA